jgi:MFS family permease
VLQLTRYQWTTLLAAWLGWGFDVFDALLFNYAAPNCVPALLGLPLGTAAAKSATLFWTGVLTSLLLIGWAIGGIVFGVMCDRLGRLRTLMLTMLIYALGTAACAMAPNIWVLAACRVVASLGIGGEWAAGASMVAEVVPDNRRVEAGALLYTASPLGLFLAAFLNYQIAGVWLADDPLNSWRYVFLCGLIPAAVAFTVRFFLKESEEWARSKSSAPKSRLSDLFAPDVIRLTIGGALASLVSLITWWSCNAFLPTVVSQIAQQWAQISSLSAIETVTLIEHWKFRATVAFNLGGLAGILLAIPIAKYWGRRAMFAVYFAFSAAGIFIVFGLELPPQVQLAMYFFIGIGVYGTCGTFTFYLPELFPTRLRGTGTGFCYNAGRIVAAAGPFVVGAAAAKGTARDVLVYVGFIPLVALALVPFIVETKHRSVRSLSG